jgi:tRNA threonylcarbamoyladenosine biosynthesis protein TsaB
VAPAGSEKTGEDIAGYRRGGDDNVASITLSQNVLVLALDTTTRAGSVAVVRGNRVLSELAGDGERTHGERLPLDLMRALALAAVALDDVELLAVAVGPGSFTGLRVGIASMQGLAIAAGLRIVPVSALDALANIGANVSRRSAEGAEAVAVWMDAQRGEVFSALYDASGTQSMIEPTSLSPTRTLDEWAARLPHGPLRFIGDGATRYAAAIHDRLGTRAEIVPSPPLAAVIGQLAAAAPDRAVLPHAVVPIYIRKPDAELARLAGRVGERK